MNIKSLLKDSVVYGVTRYFGAFAAIFLTPIYTRILSKSDYGILDIFSIWSNLVVMVLPLGLIGALVRFYSDFSDDEKLKRKNLGSIFFGLVVLTVFYSLVMFLLKDLIISNFLDNQLTSEVYYLSIFIIVGEIFKAYYMVQLQVRFEKYKYLLVSLISLFILLFLGFLFVYNLDMGVVGFFRASILSIIVSILMLLILLRHQIFLDFDWIILKKLLSYSVHLLSASFLFLVTNLIDRYLILKYYSLEEIGIYAIGVKISSLVGLAAGAFTVAWFPIAMKIKDQSNANNTFKSVHNLFFIFGFVVLFVLFLFRKELILIFAPDYMDAYRIISILSLFLLIHNTMFFYGIILHTQNKTKYLSIASLYAVIINLIVSFILLKFIGIEGVAWGTLVGSFSWIAIQYYSSNKIQKIDFNYFLSFGVIIMLLFTAFGIEYFDAFFAELSIVSISIKLGLTILIITLIAFVKIGGKTMRELIKVDFNSTEIKN